MVEILMMSSKLAPLGLLKLKVVSATFLLVNFVSLKKALVKQRKLFFYFTSKALFILEIIKF